ncbi:hypothetical protein JCM16303_005222 [Sporobolomyces ruberrimus]
MAEAVHASSSLTLSPFSALLPLLSSHLTPPETASTEPSRLGRAIAAAHEWCRTMSTTARPDPSALDAFCDFLSKQLLDFKVDSAACFASSAPTTARDATLPHAPQPRSREGNRIAAMINVVKTLIVGLNPRASARDGRWWFRAGNALVEGLLVHLEENDVGARTPQDLAYRTFICTELAEGLVKLVVPTPDDLPKSSADDLAGLGQNSEEMASKYAAMEVLGTLLSKNERNKAFLAKLFPPRYLGAILHAAWDHHLSRLTFELAFRLLPPRSAAESRATYLHQLFSEDLFGHGKEKLGQSLRRRMDRLDVSKDWEEGYQDILKKISAMHIRRSQFFEVISLEYDRNQLLRANDREPALFQSQYVPSLHEIVKKDFYEPELLWISRHIIASTIVVPGDRHEQEEIEERLVVPLQGVVKLFVEDLDALVPSRKSKMRTDGSLDCLRLTILIDTLHPLTISSKPYPAQPSHFGSRLESIPETQASENRAADFGAEENHRLVALIRKDDQVLKVLRETLWNRGKQYAPLLEEMADFPKIDYRPRPASPRDLVTSSRHARQTTSAESSRPLTLLPSSNILVDVDVEKEGDPNRRVTFEAVQDALPKDRRQKSSEVDGVVEGAFVSSRSRSASVTRDENEETPTLPPTAQEQDQEGATSVGGSQELAENRRQEVATLAKLAETTRRGRGGRGGRAREGLRVGGTHEATVDSARADQRTSLEETAEKIQLANPLPPVHVGRAARVRAGEIGNGPQATSGGEPRRALRPAADTSVSSNLSEITSEEDPESADRRFVKSGGAKDRDDALELRRDAVIVDPELDKPSVAEEYQGGDEGGVGGRPAARKDTDTTTRNPGRFLRSRLPVTAPSRTTDTPEAPHAFERKEPVDFGGTKKRGRAESSVEEDLVHDAEELDHGGATSTGHALGGVDETAEILPRPEKTGRDDHGRGRKTVMSAQTSKPSKPKMKRRKLPLAPVSPEDTDYEADPTLERKRVVPAASRKYGRDRRTPDKTVGTTRRAGKGTKGTVRKPREHSSPPALGDDSAAERQPRTAAISRRPEPASATADSPSIDIKSGGAIDAPKANKTGSEERSPRTSRPDMQARRKGKFVTPSVVPRSSGSDKNRDQGREVDLSTPSPYAVSIAGRGIPKPRAPTSASETTSGPTRKTFRELVSESVGAPGGLVPEGGQEDLGGFVQDFYRSEDESAIATKGENSQARARDARGAPRSLSPVPNPTTTDLSFADRAFAQSDEEQNSETRQEPRILVGDTPDHKPRVVTGPPLGHHRISSHHESARPQGDTTEACEAGAADDSGIHLMPANDEVAEDRRMLRLDEAQAGSDTARLRGTPRLAPSHGDPAPLRSLAPDKTVSLQPLPRAAFYPVRADPAQASAATVSRPAPTDASLGRPIGFNAEGEDSRRSSLPKSPPKTTTTSYAPYKAARTEAIDPDPIYSRHAKGVGNLARPGLSMSLRSDGKGKAAALDLPDSSESTSRLETHPGTDSEDDDEGLGDSLADFAQASRFLAAFYSHVSH